MIVTSDQLLYENKNYANPQCRIQNMVKKGELIPLKRGLYETEATTPGYLLANVIYGPSYLSFEYALSYYGLIPERVYTYTSATFGRNKKIKFQNRFGTYTYRDIPLAVYPHYYDWIPNNDRPYQIATKEKALCDYLYTLSPIRGLSDFTEYLFEGMRLDEELFYELDFEIIRQIAPLYHRTNLNQLVRLIEKESEIKR